VTGLSAIEVVHFSTGIWYTFELVYTHNAVIKNMQNLRSVVRICMKHGWLEKDPFVHYKFTLDDTERGYLSLVELKVMEEVSLFSERLDHVRDVFIFCCYTGLAYADVSKLSKTHFEDGEDGITWIKLNRTKSKSRSVIPLLPRAREILDKYQQVANSNIEKKLLPVISNQNLNKYLKEVAELCGITKRVSMHLARHTFATSVTLGKGIDIMTVSKMLGHKNLRTTQIYSKVTELKIAEDMKKLM
jgi:site-specific recombinase XerD